MRILDFTLENYVPITVATMSTAEVLSVVLATVDAN